MAAINDLIRQITDPDLRDRIQKEVNKLAKQKKFGLVFEEHLPECTPLYDIPVHRGAKAALKAGDVSDFYQVLKVEDGKALCIKRGESEAVEFPVADLVTIAEFGEPIYPYLKLVDTVCNAPDSNLWHTLIEADNYHALQLLEYLYAGQVDCIYIDPPYNTGARDWKYNNDYVDNNDQYRHSKWLSMMQKRLKIAKKVLKPNGVLICAIDDNELNSLGLLLSELFPEKKITPVAIVHNPSGTQGNNFSYNNEFLYFVYNASIVSIFPEERSDEEADIRPFMNGAKGKSGNYLRSSGATTFYPIIVKDQTVVGFGDVSDDSYHPKDRVIEEDGLFYVYPIDNENVERKWLFARDTVESVQQELFIRNDKNGLPVVYRKKNRINRKTVWVSPNFSAKQYGSILIKNIISRDFSFPKSIYAVEEAIKSCVEYLKDALILDFFAGSGTTLHAVNLLNSEDGGHRRCILVTNNEVSDEEAQEMKSRGLKPGDVEWDELGIARHVTWPRTVCSIEGHDVNGQPLKGNYLGSDRSMSDGFASNAVYFQLGFLDKTAVSLGMKFKEMLPTLWMKSGCIGRCPELADGQNPDMLILPENKFAVLINEQAFTAFEEALTDHQEIQTVFLTTDYEVNYRSMVKNLNVEHTYQLYRDYLDHFRLNGGRS